jgi:cyclopropane-fatty-acyl-phospholipid synthase
LSAIAQRLPRARRVRTDLFDEIERRLARTPIELGQPFAITLPGGESRRFGAGALAFTIVVCDEVGVDALASFDDLAVAEAYMNAHFDVEGSLVEMLRYRPLLSDRRPVRYLWETYGRPLTVGQVAADKKTIAGHYDLPAEFFELWLDRAVRGYSHGFFASEDEALETAMERKFQFAFDACRLRAGERVLDIGGGWGSFVEFAGKRGVHVTTLTISKASAAYMRDLVRRQSLSAEIIQEHFLAYQPRKRFDAIVNLGVSEHLPDYRGTLRNYQRLLEPGRRVYLDAYTGPRHNMSSFVTKWVYEGNTSPLCLAQYFAALEGTDLEVKLMEDDRRNYELTCRKWAENLEAVAPQIRARWGELLLRRFRLYLRGCERAFADGTLGAQHLVLEHVPGLRTARKLFAF